MHDNQQSGSRTHAQENESVFIFQVVGVIEQPGLLVQKHGLRLVKRDAVFLDVRACLRLVPRDLRLVIRFQVCTMY